MHSELFMDGSYDIVYDYEKWMLLMNVFYAHVVMLVITWLNMHVLLINYKYHPPWRGFI